MSEGALAGVLMGFDPHAYTIIIRRVVLDGKPLFKGRVVELPDLEAYEDSYAEAYEFLIDGIEAAKEAFDSEGRRFPAPLQDSESEYSGRVTIRMPTWLHAQLDYYAKADQTSLNQYMITLLSWAVTASTWLSVPRQFGWAGSTWDQNPKPQGRVGTPGTLHIGDIQQIQFTTHVSNAPFGMVAFHAEDVESDFDAAAVIRVAPGQQKSAALAKGLKRVAR